MEFHNKGRGPEAGAEFSEIVNLSRKGEDRLAKYVPEEELDTLDEIMKDLREEMSSLITEGGFEYA